MPKNQHTIPPTRRLRLQKVQRGRRKQDGVYKTTYLAKVDGRVKVQGVGLFWVHDPAGTDNNGNTIYGAPRKMPMLSGAVIDPRPNLKVDVVTVRGVDYIARMNKTELDRMGYDAHQTNILDPQRKYIPIEHLTNFQAFSTPGVATVQVTGSIFRKSDGTYGIFPTTGGYDLITGNTPSTDMQVVICQWFDTDAEDVVVTVSSEISRDIDLTAPANIATRIGLINECAALAPANSLGITAWQIYDTTTSITNKNKLDDLRGIVGTGHGSVDVHANTLLLNDGSELTIASDTITVTKARHTVDTQANAASDDLATVNGLAANEVCVITAENTARTVVIKHGVNNIVSVTGADITLDDHIKAVLLLGSIDGTEVWAYPLGSGTPSLTLDDLTDVTITSPATYHTLRYNGSAWVNVKNNVTTTDPTITDDSTQGYAVWSRWLNTNTDIEWICSDATPSAAVWVESVSRLGVQTLANKTISASANTLIIGTGVSKTLSGDVLSAGTDRHIVVSAESGTTDVLREITGLSVGESIYLRAASGHGILVDHDFISATVKIHLYFGDIGPLHLDENNWLKLTLTATNILAEATQNGVDRALSNLTSTSIGSNLIPNTDDSVDIGSSATKWRTTYTNLLVLEERSAPSTPASGDYAVYPKSDGLLYGLNDGATEHRLSHVVVSANKVHKFGANQSTSSNTMVDVDATNAAITATLTGGGKCRVACAFRAIKNTAGSGFFRLTDGTNSSNEVEVIQAASPELMVIHWVFDTSAGSTTYKLQYRSDNANTITLQAGIAVGMTLLEVA